jgi:hypothetical protein
VAAAAVVVLVDQLVRGREAAEVVRWKLLPSEYFFKRHTPYLLVLEARLETTPDRLLSSDK